MNVTISLSNQALSFAQQAAQHDGISLQEYLSSFVNTHVVQQQQESLAQKETPETTQESAQERAERQARGLEMLMQVFADNDYAKSLTDEDIETMCREARERVAERYRRRVLGY